MTIKSRLINFFLILLIFQACAPFVLAIVSSKSIVLSSEQISIVVKKSVVVIRCLKEGGGYALGSGFFVHADGLIATNAHVVEACSDVIVSTPEMPEAILAHVAYFDQELDIAILSVHALGQTPLKLGDSSLAKQGQKVYAIGHPIGLEYTMSEGIISAFRELKTSQLLQTTAAISPGSSGGPLVDSRARVIGMTTSNIPGGQNLNFAVPSNEIGPAIAEARKNLKSKEILPAMSSSTAARIARLLRKQNDFQTTSKILAVALAKDSSNVDLLLQQAELAWDEKKLDEAEVIVNKMLELDPKFAPAHQFLGAILIAKGQKTQGCEEEKRSLELSPDETYLAYASSLLYRCEIDLNKNSMTKEQFRSHVANVVFPYLETALRLPEIQAKPDVHVDRAISLLIMGRNKEANAEARSVLKMTDATEVHREKLKQFGLPQVEVRVVSTDFDRQFYSVGIARMTGVVVNEGSETVSNVKVIVECKNDAGTIVRTGTASIYNSIPAGASAQFDVMLGEPVKSQCFARILSLNSGFLN
jgi:tetratricopeptide (TPR) repeat protein